MNDLLKNLYGKSRLYAFEQLGHVNEHAGETLTEVADKKFAELIIQECVNTCELIGTQAELMNDGEMARKTKATANSCAFMIKEIFGVK